MAEAKTVLLTSVMYAVGWIMGAIVWETVALIIRKVRGR